jgi:hypothetical protein
MICPEPLYDPEQYPEVVVKLMLHSPSKLVSAFEAGIAKTIAASVAPAKMSFRVEGRNMITSCLNGDVYAASPNHHPRSVFSPGGTNCPVNAEDCT